MMVINICNVVRCGQNRSIDPRMSCNGCRVLRKGCGEGCPLRSCLQWIQSPQAQANATLFLAKFFGRSDLMSFISSVPQSKRPALFQSLLFEACGRTVNPVNGAVGLLWSGSWHVCEAAVETVLAGGVLRPLPGFMAPNMDESLETFSAGSSKASGLDQASDLISLSPMPEFYRNISNGRGGGRKKGCAMMMVKRERDQTASFLSEESGMASYGGSGNAKKKLLNLFV